MVEGGTAHGWERSTDQLVCLEVPLPPYIKEQGGGRPGPVSAPGGGFLLLAHPIGPAGLPLAPIYKGAGAPLDTQVDLLIYSSRVSWPPPP